jgi:hypothetical protein
MPSQTEASLVPVYASPRNVTQLSDCYFYHTMDLPGFGLVEGEWDLREGIADYLGHVDFRGRRVLEVGTASGLLCFHMERCGADVVAYDLSSNQSWDIVPFAQGDTPDVAHGRKHHIDRINNSYWLAHRVLKSQARVVYGTVYNVPQEIGAVDVATFGSILLHMRDPFLALQNVLSLTREAVVVTEICAPEYGSLARLRAVLGRAPLKRARWLADSLRPRGLEFRPDFATQEPKETWWHFTPQPIIRMLGVLGFSRTTLTYHTQKWQRSPVELFTVVGYRTHGRAIGT